MLVIDVGGNNIKILATGQTEPRKLPTGPKFTAEKMVTGVKDLARDWNYDAISIGFPAPVRQDRPIEEPFNLGRGWVGFDFNTAFGRPVKMINDAAMQALGSYKGGKMLFLGLGTGLGSAMIVQGIVVPTELCRGRCKATPLQALLITLPIRAPLVADVQARSVCSIALHRYHADIVIKVILSRETAHFIDDGWEELIYRQCCQAIQARDQRLYTEFVSVR